MISVDPNEDLALIIVLFRDPAREVQGRRMNLYSMGISVLSVLLSSSSIIPGTAKIYFFLVLCRLIFTCTKLLDECCLFITSCLVVSCL